MEIERVDTQARRTHVCAYFIVYYLSCGMQCVWDEWHSSDHCAHDSERMLLWAKVMQQYRSLQTWDYRTMGFHIFKLVLTLGGPIIMPVHLVSVISSSSSRPQLTVPSPTPFWPSSSSSNSRKLRGTFTPKNKSKISVEMRTPGRGQNKIWYLDWCFQQFCQNLLLKSKISVKAKVTL